MESRSATSALPIAVDAMGGDLGVGVPVEGAVLAAKNLGIESVLVGIKDQIEGELARLGFSGNRKISVMHAGDVISMEDSPAISVKRKPDSSIMKAFSLIKEGRASSVVSAGNTGAVMAAGMAVSGTLPGIVRPAIASLIPQIGSSEPAIFLDSGANTDCHAYQLVQFALMGNYYASLVVCKENPRVALLSNGTESSKGTDIIRSAAVILSKIPALNFTGYIEGNDISKDAADVIVCDGFTGNVLLKTIEGSVDLVFETLKTHVKKSAMGNLGLWLSKPVFKSVFQESLDSSSYGGAPLLGLNDVAIICHGASNTRSIMNGIRVADKLVRDGLLKVMGDSLGELDQEMPGGYGNGVWERVGMRFGRNKEGKSQKSGAGEVHAPANMDKASTK